MTTSSQRIAEFEVAPQFINRWSPRAFTGEAIPENTLFAFFEAARWAPSASNEQPWRFIYTRRGDASWQGFVDVLSENNRQWAQNASALVIIVSKKTRAARDGGGEQTSRSHSFDTGAAWAHFALQASLSGWATHGIGGFDREKSRELFQIPENYAVEAAVAIGRQGERETLPESLRGRETPNGRLPLNNIVFAHTFSS